MRPDLAVGQQAHHLGGEGGQIDGWYPIGYRFQIVEQPSQRPLILLIPRHVLARQLPPGGDILPNLPEGRQVLLPRYFRPPRRLDQRTHRFAQIVHEPAHAPLRCVERLPGGIVPGLGVAPVAGQSRHLVLPPDHLLEVQGPLQMAGPIPAQVDERVSEQLQQRTVPQIGDGGSQQVSGQQAGRFLREGDTGRVVESHPGILELSGQTPGEIGIGGRNGDPGRPVPRRARGRNAIPPPVEFLHHERGDGAALGFGIATRPQVDAAALRQFRRGWLRPRQALTIRRRRILGNRFISALSGQRCRHSPRRCQRVADAVDREERGQEKPRERIIRPQREEMGIELIGQAPQERHRGPIDSGEAGHDQ